LPGDCTNIGGSGTQPDKLRVGNGDGMIRGYVPQTSVPNANNGWGGLTTSSSEWADMFDYLAAFDMYPMATYDETVVSSHRAGVAYPKMTLDNGSPYTMAGVTADRGGVIVGWEPAMDYIHAGHKITLGICAGGSSGLANPGTSNGASFFCGPSMQDMKALDAKLDDGRPYSGKVYINSDLYLYRIPNSTVGIDVTWRVGDSATNQYRPEWVGTPGTCITQGCYAKFAIEADF